MINYQSVKNYIHNLDIYNNRYEYYWEFTGKIFKILLPLLIKFDITTVFPKHWIGRLIYISRWGDKSIVEACKLYKTTFYEFWIEPYNRFYYIFSLWQVIYFLDKNYYTVNEFFELYGIPEVEDIYKKIFIDRDKLYKEHGHLLFVEWLYAKGDGIIPSDEDIKFLSNKYGIEVENVYKFYKNGIEDRYSLL